MKANTMTNQNQFPRIFRPDPEPNAIEFRGVDRATAPDLHAEIVIFNGRLFTPVTMGETEGRN